jgi:hypothetical protein
MADKKRTKLDDVIAFLVEFNDATKDAETSMTDIKELAERNMISSAACSKLCSDFALLALINKIKRGVAVSFEPRWV